MKHGTIQFRKRRPLPATKPLKPVDSEPKASGSRAQKRKSISPSEDGGPRLSKRQRQEYAYLKPKTRQIPQSLITKQWKALSEPAQQQIRTIVNTAKRNVTYSSRDLDRAQEAEQTLDRLLKLLHRRLPRMPFPKNSKDMHFDLGKLLERNRALESQLTPMIHTIELLNAAIEDETKALARDQQAVSALLDTVKAREAEQKRMAKKAHPLLERLASVGPIEDDAESIGFAPISLDSRSPFDSQDPDVQPFADQLKDHLATMAANLEQVAGIDEVINQASVALCAVVPPDEFATITP